MIGNHWSGWRRRMAAAVSTLLLACSLGCQQTSTGAVPLAVNESTPASEPTASSDSASASNSTSATDPKTADDPVVSESSASDASAANQSELPQDQYKAAPADAGKEKTADTSSKEQTPDAKIAATAKNEEAAPREQDVQNPFMQQVPVPELPQDLPWLNVSKPLRKADLQGKFVLLDFWTYCCINCMHILPELKKLEQAYPNQLVVIGVHSAKFETEKGNANIEEAILRYEIEHPVINDADHRIWDTYGVRSWPSVILIDPTGNAVWGRSGEFKADEIQQLLESALPYYRSQKLLNEKPIRFALLANKQKKTPLRFPGKVFADEPGKRLFIADSNHNRIVVATLDGKCLEVIGSGEEGRMDGDYSTATFDHPQGMVLHGDTLYVADTENHLLRKIDLAQKRVTTIAGTGAQARSPWPGLDKLTPGAELPERWVGKPQETALSSPWDVQVHEKDLYIAMAGPHQIWKMPLDESEIGPYAGNGREDIVDGPLLPKEPYEQGYASFAQPSGLASDGEWLYVADSEGSSIRAVPFDAAKEVRTVVGTAKLPFNRLFHFGDQDGPRGQVLLQHCLGVAYHDGTVYVADTYNSKIKAVDAKTGATRTIAGEANSELDPFAEFDEPGGLDFANGLLYIADTNNHRIRTIELSSGNVSTLNITDLPIPSSP